MVDLPDHGQVQGVESLGAVEGDHPLVIDPLKQHIVLCWTLSSHWPVGLETANEIVQCFDIMSKEKILKM